MRESKWLDSFDPKEMLEYLLATGRLTDRKLRLFTVACCRHIWHLMGDERSRKAVEVAERYADGQATEKELATARTEAGGACEGFSARLAAEDSYSAYDGDAAEAAEDDYCRYPGEDYAGSAAYWAVSIPCSTHAAENARDIAGFNASGAEDGDFETGYNAECDYQRAILRDIFGNPFRPITLDAAWRTRTVLSLAQAAYDNRILHAGTLDPNRLAVLADALEEAGCDNADILNHLRQPGDHVRGCWVLDLILSKDRSSKIL